MIAEFVDRFMNKKPELRAVFESGHPEDYKAIVKSVASLLADDSYDSISPDRIHEIDDGDYQGTLLYLIASNSYQPNTYWYVRVRYGSCSGCDTLQAIQDYDTDNPPTEQQVDDYMALALHIVQGLKELPETDEA